MHPIYRELSTEELGAARDKIFRPELNKPWNICFANGLCEFVDAFLFESEGVRIYHELEEDGELNYFEKEMEGGDRYSWEMGTRTYTQGKLRGRELIFETCFHCIWSGKRGPTDEPPYTTKEEWIRMQDPTSYRDLPEEFRWATYFLLWEGAMEGDDARLPGTGCYESSSLTYLACRSLLTEEEMTVLKAEYQGNFQTQLHYYTLTR